MPTSLHQGVVALFRDDPRLVFDLLAEVFGLELPSLAAISDRHGALDRFAPCFGDTGELRPDLVVTGEDPSDRAAGIAAIIEVQRRVDGRKRWRIWVYWALVAEQLSRPTAVLLVPLSQSVSRWARSLAATELPPREGLLVLDRVTMPRVTAGEQARRRPALAVLSALIHAEDEDLEVLRVALAAVLELADERRWRYASTLLSAVDERSRSVLLGALTMDEREELTQRELNSIAYHNGLRAGEREGRAQGEREGRLAERAQLLLTVLELRGLSVDAAREAEIRSCRDLDQLARWTARAKRATQLTEVFAG